VIIPLDYAQVNMKFTGDAAPTGAQITFGVDVSAFAGDPTNLGATVSSNWASASCDELYVGALTLAEILVKFGPNEDGPFGVYPVGVDGTAANPSTLCNGALLVRKVTSMGGRKGRGRLFLPGVPENHVDGDGSVASGYLTSATEDLNDFLGKMATDDARLVLLHNDPDVDPATTVVDSFAPSALMATQRRRLRR
jgi:hypothetical protein